MCNAEIKEAFKRTTPPEPTNLEDVIMVNGAILRTTSKALWKHGMLENYIVGSKIWPKRRFQSTGAPALSWQIYRRTISSASADVECSAMLQSIC